jgi:hypothetical protein
MTSAFSQLWPQLAVFPIVGSTKKPAVRPSRLPPHTKCLADGKCPACDEWISPYLDRETMGFAIATGTRSGVFVIDTDSPEADAWLNEQNIPRTLKVATGSRRGFHYYFQQPDFLVKNSASKLFPKVDVKGEGGYVLAPSSPHDSGKLYEIVDDVEPAPWVEL